MSRMKNSRAKNHGVQNIYSIKNTKLPHDTRNILKGDIIDNYLLKLNKTVNFIYEKNEEKPLLYKAEYKDKRDNNRRKKFEIEFNFNRLYGLIQTIIKRQERTLRCLFGDNNYRTFEFSPEWRMIVGLGNESVYETSITLHHIYGIPYIPAQAVKGVTRSWIIIEKFNGKEENALRDELFCRIFGSPKNSVLKEHQGSVIFFDAFPVSPPKIEYDIMNPHYKEYYAGNNKPPADYLKPSPVPFLTVSRKTRFRLAIGIKQKNNKKLDSFSSELLRDLNGQPISGLRTILDVVEYWLKSALSEHGIGAKTAVGYGWGNI